MSKILSLDRGRDRRPEFSGGWRCRVLHRERAGRRNRTRGERSIAARSGGDGLCCPTDVAIVQTADFGNRQDLTSGSQCSADVPRAGLSWVREEATALA